MNARHTGELSVSSVTSERQPAPAGQRRAPLTEQLPLGPTLATGDTSAATTTQDSDDSPIATRPFGARFAIASKPIQLDLAAVRYDTDQQIAVIDIDGETMPLLDPRLGLTLHTTGTVPTEDEVFDKDEKY